MKIYWKRPCHSLHEVNMGDQVRRRIHTVVVDDLILLRVVEWNIRDIIPLAHKVIFNLVGILIY